MSQGVVHLGVAVGRLLVERGVRDVLQCEGTLSIQPTSIKRVRRRNGWESLSTREGGGMS